MKSLLLASTIFVSLSMPAAAALLTVEVFDNTTLVDTETSSTGALSIATHDAVFSDISVDVAGPPLLPFANLSSTTLDVSDVSAGLHVLTIDVFQTGVTGTGPTHSTFTTNNLFGAEHILTAESTFAGGTSSTLGTLLAAHTFPAGTVSGDAGPVLSQFGDISADAHQYRIAFTGPGSADDTIQLSTNVPEPSTWAMLLLGCGLLSFVGWRKKGKNRLSIA